TEDATLSRMTIVTTGSADVIEQILKQLDKLIDVVRVVNLTEGVHIERELMMVKVSTSEGDADEIMRLTDIFRGKIIDVSDDTYTIELTGDGAKLDAFLQALDRNLIVETVRTGASGIGRGSRILNP
ncbi:MAG: acetolactate synthase small subunit, partial [Pseudomonadota bacterium]|nr:acetolactate synthase small subunit [Pseudomonadota bacterium]